MMKRLFFVRHGETEMNVARMWSGQTETPLTDRGKEQARLAGQQLSAKLPQIDVIVCSPFSRALHTAQIIAGEIGFPVDKIVTNELFVERSFGTLEGKSSKNYYDEYTFQDLEDIHGAESVVQLQLRAKAALEYITSLEQDNVLVVSHGTFGRAFRREVEKLSHTLEYDNAHRELYRMANAEVVELI